VSKKSIVISVHLRVAVAQNQRHADDTNATDVHGFFFFFIIVLLHPFNALGVEFRAVDFFFVPLNQLSP
jgi:hypothetical protein